MTLGGILEPELGTGRCLLLTSVMSSESTGDGGLHPGQAALHTAHWSLQGLSREGQTRRVQRHKHKGLN